MQCEVVFLHVSRRWMIRGFTGEVFIRTACFRVRTSVGQVETLGLSQET